MTKSDAKYRIMQKLADLAEDEDLFLVVKKSYLEYARKKLKPEKAFSVRPRPGGFLVYRLK